MEAPRGSLLPGWWFGVTSCPVRAPMLLFHYRSGRDPRRWVPCEAAAESRLQKGDAQRVGTVTLVPHRASLPALQDFGRELVDV